jgi:hypothetical protein
MALMRFDPFGELDPSAEQAMTSPLTARTLPMEALRHGDQFIGAESATQQTVDA